MFPIHYTIEQRRNRLHDFLHRNEQEIAVLVAAADLERTCRRAIIALSYITPTTIVRLELESKFNSIAKYPSAWKRFVETSGHRSFESLFPNFSDVKQAFVIRNKLIHGQSGTTGLTYASRRVDLIFDMTTKLDEYAHKCGVNLSQRIKVRRKVSAI